MVGSPSNRIDLDGGNGSLVADGRRKELRRALIDDEHEPAAEQAAAGGAAASEQAGSGDSGSDSDGLASGVTRRTSQVKRLA